MAGVSDVDLEEELSVRHWVLWFTNSHMHTCMKGELMLSLSHMNGNYWGTESCLLSTVYQ